MDLTLIASECRRNSERWFPEMHRNEDMPSFYALALAGEVGELCNIVKKYVRKEYDVSLFATMDIDSELADIFTYLLLLADELHVDLLTALETKQKICEERWG